MAYQKLQVSNALDVYPDSTVRIPDPSSVVSIKSTTNPKGVTVGVASISTTTLTASNGEKFTEAGILPGAIIYNKTAKLAYYVVEVLTDLTISISGATAGGGTDDYSIYNRATQGCILFVGVGGNVTVQMAAQNGNTTVATQSLNHEIEFKGIGSGCFMPTQVVRVDGRSTADNIIALW